MKHLVKEQDRHFTVQSQWFMQNCKCILVRKEQHNLPSVCRPTNWV